MDCQPRTTGPNSSGIFLMLSSPTTISGLPCSWPTSTWFLFITGWLWSSVLLLSGTPTCPGRHIGSKSASLHHFHLVVMHLDPGRATSSSDHLLKAGTLVFTGFGGWSELNGVSTLKWPISL